MTVASTDQDNKHRKPTERRFCSYVKCLYIHSPSCALLRFLDPYLCLDSCFGGTERKLRGLVRLSLIYWPTIGFTNFQLFSSWNNASHTYSELLLMQFICKIFHTKAEQRFQSQMPLGVQQKMNTQWRPSWVQRAPCLRHSDPIFLKDYADQTKCTLHMMAIFGLRVIC